MPIVQLFAACVIARRLHSPMIENEERAVTGVLFISR